MGMRRSINKSVLAIFAVIITGFVVTGFLVSPDSKTDDGFPLNFFFWGMAGMFLASNLGVLVWVRLSNSRRERIEKTWIDADAEILEMNETGTYINNQPKIRFKLQVNSPVSAPCEVVHKQVIPLTALVQFKAGTTIKVKVNPNNPHDIMLL